MMSSILAPRSDLADCSPNTHFIASVMLLFPLPFGPTIAVTPSSNCTFVCSANDLNPKASIDFKYTMLFSFKVFLTVLQFRNTYALVLRLMYSLINYILLLQRCLKYMLYFITYSTISKLFNFVFH